MLVASLLAKAGVPLEFVSNRLGHAPIRITVEKYCTFMVAGTLRRQGPWIGWPARNERGFRYSISVERSLEVS
jgi:hypothetical protein